jgi:hypothetical protein
MTPRLSMAPMLPEDGPSSPVNLDDGACQLDLFAPARGVKSEEKWDAIMSQIRLAVVEMGPKNVAYDLDLSQSQLAHLLAERDRNFPGKYVMYFVEKSRRGPIIVSYLAASIEHELIPLRKLEPAEELAKLKEAMGRHLGPDLNRMIMRDARSSK